MSAFSWGLLLTALGGVALSVSNLATPDRVWRALAGVALGLFVAAGVCVVIGLG